MGLSLDARHLLLRLSTNGTTRRAPSEQDAGGRTLFSIDQLALQAGESLAIYGPSGSGKTTLLHLLAGLQRLDCATVTWRGEEAAGRLGAVELTQLSSTACDVWRLQNVGLVFQQIQLFSSMTALENVLTPVRFDHWSVPSDVQLRALALLDHFGVSATASTGRLSRGEQQRVAIARALIRRPAVVLADEPTASLDPLGAQHVMNLLTSECAVHGVTLIVATHDHSMSSKFHTAMTLHDGVLVALAPEKPGLSGAPA